MRWRRLPPSGTLERPWPEGSYSFIPDEKGFIGPPSVLCPSCGKKWPGMVWRPERYPTRCPRCSAPVTFIEEVSSDG